MKIDAMVLHEGCTELRCETLELDAPKAGEVLVRTRAVGICHSDINILHGAFPYPKPCVLGHEGAGVVEAIGEGVTKVLPGDHVVLTFNSCGACYQCTHDHPAYCPDMPALNFAGVRPDGSTTLVGADGPVHGSFFSQSSFATHCIAASRNVVKVDKSVSFDLLAPLGCGVQTGAGAVMNVLKPAPEQSIAVLGSGTVGLSAILGAKLRGCRTIIAVDKTQSRLDLAKSLGATHTVNVTTGSFLDLARKLGGIDFCVDTTGSPGVVAGAVEQLRLNGACALVGFSDPAATIPLSLMHMTFGRTITGVIEGDSDPDIFIPELISEMISGRFAYDRLITRYPFSDISRAIHDMEEGSTVKPVLLFD